MRRSPGAAPSTPIGPLRTPPGVSVTVDESMIVAQAREWYRSNWDPDLTVGAWFRMMHNASWAYPTWPERWGARDLPIAFAKLVRAERRAAGALGPPSGIGASLLPPMLLRHGNDEQRDRFLRGMAYGEITFCQMLSEPEAGSDLAATRTSAVRDGAEWRITGMKVWTSNVAIVTYGMLLARTNWDAPKHRGLTFFLCPSQQPGVEVHLMRQMNGRAEFHLVNFNEAIVDERDVLGPAGDGWAVTRTFLMPCFRVRDRDPGLISQHRGVSGWVVLGFGCHGR
jgi:alkylation response protein AidB-like acyl-CoA dehydrogenase